MRVFGCGRALLTAWLITSPVLADPGAALATPAEQAPPTPPEPPPGPPAPATPEPPPARTEPTTPTTSEEAPAAPPTGSPTLPSSPPLTAPLDDRHPATTLGVPAQRSAGPAAPLPTRFARDFAALPLTLEARFGFNTRLSRSFDAPTQEQLLDSTIAVGAYLAWSPYYALGLELEHAGLGRVRGLNGENSIDADYTSNSLWLGARVFPWRSERWDVFVDLRLGLAMQHVDVLGTRQASSSITVPATSFSCAETDGPGLGLGGAVGASLRVSRHFSVQSRLDASAERLSGDALGTCADGIGSVATISGTVGVAFEFETARR